MHPAGLAVVQRSLILTDLFLVHLEYIFYLASSYGSLLLTCRLFLHHSLLRSALGVLRKEVARYNKPASYREEHKEDQMSMRPARSHTSCVKSCAHGRSNSTHTASDG